MTCITESTHFHQCSINTEQKQFVDKTEVKQSELLGHQWAFHIKADGITFSPFSSSLPFLSVAMHHLYIIIYTKCEKRRGRVWEQIRLLLSTSLSLFHYLIRWTMNYLLYIATCVYRPIYAFTNFPEKPLHLNCLPAF